MVFARQIAVVFNLACAELYCPSKDDMHWAYGEPQLYDGGWTVNGAGGAALKSTFNLLNGYIEYDIDFRGVPPGVNANLYAVFPNVSGFQYNHSVDYCDGGQNDLPRCAELDFIESNGNCGGATTWHTKPGPGDDGCTAWGCVTDYHYLDQHGNGTAAFHMRIDFEPNGVPIVRRWHSGHNGVFDELDADSFHPKPNATAYDVIKASHEATGAAIVSTQWEGWVPVSDCGSKPGGLDNSSFSVSNIKIAGKVVQGPEPTLCSVLV
jgi:hypothetical protein